MRITLVTHYFPAHHGGVEIVAGHLAHALASAHGASITWHASDSDTAPRIPGVECVPAKACNAAERHLGFPYPLWSPGALLAVSRAARRSQVLHLHDCLYMANIVACIAARLAGRPVIVTQHVGMVPYRSRLLRALLSAGYRILGHFVLRHATQVIFVSHAVRRYFEMFVRFRSPALIVANGVDTRTFRPTDAAQRRRLRADLGVADGVPLLIFVGRFVEKKGLPVLRELARRLSHARWIFAGWGALDPEAWALPNVTVVRGRSGAGLTGLYQAADLLVLPSVGEGFPLVVQEAMACGTPALVGTETAAGWPDTGDLLYTAETGGADVARHWERRLRDVLSEPRELVAMRDKVAAYAATHWSWEQCAARYAAILRQCATG